jgi:hypothetical protein
MRSRCAFRLPLSSTGGSAKAGLDSVSVTDYDEGALQAALEPGIAKAKAMFDAVAKEMAGKSAEDVHAALVKRLEAEPFEWDDTGLRKIASSISGASADAEEPDSEPAEDSATGGSADESADEGDSSAAKNADT